MPEFENFGFEVGTPRKSSKIHMGSMDETDFDNLVIGAVERARKEEFTEIEKLQFKIYAKHNVANFFGQLLQYLTGEPAGSSDDVETVESAE